MHWSEKVKRLLATSKVASYRQAEILAGWPENTLNQAVGKKANVRIDKAMSLAKALDVSADWLFDDEAEWEDNEPTNRPSKYLLWFARTTVNQLLLVDAVVSTSRTARAVWRCFLFAMLDALEDKSKLTPEQIQLVQEIIFSAAQCTWRSGHGEDFDNDARRLSEHLEKLTGTPHAIMLERLTKISSEIMLERLTKVAGADEEPIQP